MGYGTGAIMGAPGQDQRDFEFASKYGLEILRVTAPLDGRTPPADRAFSEPGVAINSGLLNGMKTADAIRAVCEYAERKKYRSRERHLPYARLGDLAPALLGLSDAYRVLQG